VTARGNRRQVLFVDDGDFRWFLAIVSDVATRLGWRCHSYCLMPNHYHLLIETRNADLSVGMQRLNGRYAQAFNHSHATSGHLFQGRFHAVLVENEGHLLEVSRYIALNPVRAGLCREPGEWRWSSYRALLEGRAPQPFLALERSLEYFDPDRARAQRAFRAFVHDASARAA